MRLYGADVERWDRLKVKLGYKSDYALLRGMVSLLVPIAERGLVCPETIEEELIKMFSSLSNTCKEYNPEMRSKDNNGVRYSINGKYRKLPNDDIGIKCNETYANMFVKKYYHRLYERYERMEQKVNSAGQTPLDYFEEKVLSLYRLDLNFPDFKTFSVYAMKMFSPRAE